MNYRPDRASRETATASLIDQGTRFLQAHRRVAFDAISDTLNAASAMAGTACADSCEDRAPMIDTADARNCRNARAKSRQRPRLQKFADAGDGPVHVG